MNLLRLNPPLALSVAILFLLSPPAYSEKTNFTRVDLPRGMHLQLPTGWWLLGKDLNQMIETSAEAALDLAGLDVGEGQEVNLIAANSMPRTTYAAVRVDSTVPPTIQPSELLSASPQEVAEIAPEMKDNLQKVLPQQGLYLLEFYGIRKDSINDHPTLVTEYRRTGPKGPVHVQINQVFTRSQELRINLSYRESEAVLWKPVTAKIRASITVE